VPAAAERSAMRTGGARTLQLFSSLAGKNQGLVQ
jgi:hypothetical protein